jgi:hypothetical protein
LVGIRIFERSGRRGARAGLSRPNLGRSLAAGLRERFETLRAAVHRIDLRHGECAEQGHANA